MPARKLSSAKVGLTRHSPPEERAPEVIRRLKKAYPDAKVALIFSNPLETLVATILSAQTTDQGVNQVTRTLFHARSIITFDIAARRSFSFT